MKLRAQIPWVALGYCVGSIAGAVFLLARTGPLPEGREAVTVPTAAPVLLFRDRFTGSGAPIPDDGLPDLYPVPRRIIAPAFSDGAFDAFRWMLDHPDVVLLPPAAGKDAQ